MELQEQRDHWDRKELLERLVLMVRLVKKAYKANLVPMLNTARVQAVGSNQLPSRHLNLLLQLVLTNHLHRRRLNTMLNQLLLHLQLPLLLLEAMERYRDMNYLNYVLLYVSTVYAATTPYNLKRVHYAYMQY